MNPHLAICEGEDGIPIWSIPPTMQNISSNKLIGWLAPFDPCIILIDHKNGTSLVIYDGVVAYAVTECLIEL